MQYYKILSTGETYALDKATGQATKVDAVPPGGVTLSWAGAGLPPELRGANIKGSSTQQDQTQQVTQSGGTPYFFGKTALIKIPTGQPGMDTYWHVDNTNKTIRPFESIDALKVAFGADADLAVSKIITINPADLGPGGMLSKDNGYDMLGGEYVIKPGEIPKSIDASQSQLKTRYGQPNNEESNQRAYTSLGGFLTMLQKTPSGISNTFLDGIKQDGTSIAFYMNALAYGGYSLTDVYRDIKKKELVNKGDLSQGNIRPISAAETKSTYQNTNEGRSANTNQATKPPLQLGGLDSNILNYTIFDIPAEAYKELVPTLKWDSPEFKAEMDKVNTLIHDVVIKQIEAKTQQEKAVADYNWDKTKKDIERTLGITLSNNAIDAWKQVEGAYEQFSQRGISGSGMETESIDEYLKGVRRSDQQTRQTTLTGEELKQAEYYQKFATPTQINQLIAEDKAAGLPQDQWRASKWGLVPSDDIKKEMSFAALKAKYPTSTDADINRYISSMFDESGNYRSKLYQGKVTDIQKAEGEKETYQKTMAQMAAEGKEKKAYKEFSAPELPFLDTVDKDKITPPAGLSTEGLSTPSATQEQVPATSQSPASQGQTEAQRQAMFKAAGLTPEQIKGVEAGTGYTTEPPKKVGTGVTGSTGSATGSYVSQYNKTIGPEKPPQTHTPYTATTPYTPYNPSTASNLTVSGTQKPPTSIPQNYLSSVTPKKPSVFAPVERAQVRATNGLGSAPSSPIYTPKPAIPKPIGPQKPTFTEKAKSTAKGLISKVKSWF